MCGIAGVLRFDHRAADVAQLSAMSSAIAHRGPDGEGTYCDGSLGLVHRRLAILDLSDAAAQPMTTADGRYTLTYNGELYNFAELRRELESEGHRFQSQGDSEVVLTAIAAWGPEAIKRFNGMFALAVWDKQRRSLLLARDRYGIKPLYYHSADNGLWFGSEVKTILAAVGARPFDRAGLVEYLTFQNFLSDRTLAEGIRMLPAGHYMVVHQQAARVPEPTQYWDFDFCEDKALSGDDRELTEELLRLFDQAVRRQLASDVEVGAFLSGGMDSGSITATAATQFPHLRTFTCGFDLHDVAEHERNFDERRTAEMLSRQFGTEHYEMVLKPTDLVRAMRPLVHHLEEPRVGQSYPNYYAAHLASKFVKVVLAGTGGDEIFGGYPWRYYRNVVNDSFRHFQDKYFGFWQRLVPVDDQPKLLAPIWNSVRDVSPREIFDSVFPDTAGERTRPEDYVNHCLYFEAKTFLHGLLVVEDKLAMAHGLESRVPLLDNDLVDFAMRLPVRLKLGRLPELVALGESQPGPRTEAFCRKTRDGKLILREAMGRLLPQKITTAIKQGFSAPDATWFRHDCQSFVRDTLLPSSARLGELLDRNALESVLESHFSGRKNHRLLIWSLMSLEEYLQTFGAGLAGQERSHAA